MHLLVPALILVFPVLRGQGLDEFLLPFEHGEGLRQPPRPAAKALEQTRDTDESLGTLFEVPRAYSREQYLVKLVRTNTRTYSIPTWHRGRVEN